MPSGWALAMLAARLFAADPAGTGLCLAAAPGPQRDRWLDALRQMLPPGTAPRKLPPGIADDRLLGGLDLAATLAAGRPIAERGLLADVEGGVLIVPSAERISPALAARIGAAHDGGRRFGLLLLDEGAGEDERPPAALMERIALRVDLAGIALRETQTATGGGPGAICAPGRVHADEEAVAALCHAAAALGIGSARAPLLALRVARIAAALGHRHEVDAADLALAGALVLAWRARIAPSAPPDADDAPPDEPPAEPRAEDAEGPTETAPLSDIVLEAARAAIPGQLLAAIAAEGMAGARQAGPPGHAGAPRKGGDRGRRIGVLQGLPRGGRRLDLIATLRAAAPWQRLRKAGHGNLAGPDNRNPPGRLAIRARDFRLRRHAERRQTLTVFAVDASGSQALHRMSEAKGAVERLLAECYIRRDEVALIAFRAARAEIILPPTRALARARRCLASLPAGGGTPLAIGIDAAAALALAARRRGRDALIVLLTDGRANLDRQGKPGRARAAQDASVSAMALARAGLASLLIDTGARPEAMAAALASAMNARYLALPRADAGAISALARQAGMGHAGIGGRRHGR